MNTTKDSLEFKLEVVRSAPRTLGGTVAVDSAVMFAITGEPLELARKAFKGDQSDDRIAKFVLESQEVKAAIHAVLNRMVQLGHNEAMQAAAKFAEAVPVQTTAKAKPEFTRQIGPDVK